MIVVREVVLALDLAAVAGTNIASAHARVPLSGAGPDLLIGANRGQVDRPQDLQHLLDLTQRRRHLEVL